MGMASAPDALPWAWPLEHLIQTRVRFPLGTLRAVDHSVSCFASTRAGLLSQLRFLNTIDRLGAESPCSKPSVRLLILLFLIQPCHDGSIDPLRLAALELLLASPPSARFSWSGTILTTSWTRHALKRLTPLAACSRVSTCSVNQLRVRGAHADLPPAESRAQHGA